MKIFSNGCSIYICIYFIGSNFQCKSSQYEYLFDLHSISKKFTNDFLLHLKVGYKVRLEGMKGRDTRLLFCTTGILLRRLLVDRNLKGVTHVFIDEIHERGMNEGVSLIAISLY